MISRMFILMLFSMLISKGSSMPLNTKGSQITQGHYASLTVAPHNLHFSTASETSQDKKHTYPLQVIGGLSNLDVWCHRPLRQSLTPKTTWQCQANFPREKGFRGLFRDELHQISVHWKSGPGDTFLPDSFQAIAYLKNYQQHVQQQESKRYQNKHSITEWCFSLLLLGIVTLLFSTIISECGPGVTEFLIGGLLGGLLCASILDDGHDTEYTSYCDGDSYTY